MIRSNLQEVLPNQLSCLLALTSQQGIPELLKEFTSLLKFEPTSLSAAIIQTLPLSCRSSRVTSCRNIVDTFTGHLTDRNQSVLKEELGTRLLVNALHLLELSNTVLQEVSHRPQ
uniref:Uncharacterized protein n=1 Tax=Trichobilharzia regenti TaxID=157069 RepID=A0AA85IVY3_TRIRE|nr:unnamed protein product [Trichobilharzia regenti]